MLSPLKFKSIRNMHNLQISTCWSMYRSTFKVKKKKGKRCHSKNDYAQQHKCLTFYMLSSIKGKTPSVLQEAQVEIIPHSACNNSDAYGGMINNNMICAGSPLGGIDSCQVRINTMPNVPPLSQSLRGIAMHLQHNSLKWHKY